MRNFQLEKGLNLFKVNTKRGATTITYSCQQRPSYMTNKRGVENTDCMRKCNGKISFVVCPTDSSKWILSSKSVGEHICPFQKPNVMVILCSCNKCDMRLTHTYIFAHIYICTHTHINTHACTHTLQRNLYICINSLSIYLIQHACIFFLLCA